MRMMIAQMTIVAESLSQNFKTIKKFIEEAKNKKVDLIIFPEMCLSGYFIGDTWEQNSFLRECEIYHQKILDLANGIDILFGSVGIDWNKKNEDGRVRKYNAAFYATRGSFVKNSKVNYNFWPKVLLPNYREFDDSRFFYDLRKLQLEKNCSLHELYEPVQIEIANEKISIGISICEDGWGDDYNCSPLEIFSQHYTHDFFVNLSASPFTKQKRDKRERTFSLLAKRINTPIFYVNCVGTQNLGKTIFGFDGSSALYIPNKQVHSLGSFFKEELVEVNYDVKKQTISSGFRATSDTITLMKELFISLEYILRNCLKEWDIRKVVIGLSGGIDSALSAVLFSRILNPQNVYLVNMYSRFNSDLTKNAAKMLAENLNCPYASIGIEESILHTKNQLTQLNFQNSTTTLNLTDFVFENIQARDRGGRILAALAASLGAVFPCNANKTELTVGYCTLYGDAAGFLSPIADLWKHEIYELAKFYNTEVYKQEIIPQDIFNVVPSAELSENQNVLQNKGDPIVYGYHDYLFRSWVETFERKTPEDILQAFLENKLEILIGCENGLVKKMFNSTAEFTDDLEKWWRLFRGMGAFKRVQTPPIVALSRRAFGSDYRENIGQVAFSETYLTIKKNSENGIKLT